MNTVLCLALALPAAAGLARVEVGPRLEIIRAVGPHGAGHRQAMAAWKDLSLASGQQLTEVLAGMDPAGELAANWIRAAVEAIADRELHRGRSLPTAELEQFLADTRHTPRARRLAYELIARVDATAEKRLIPALLNDPSVELRRDAVALALNEAESLASANDRPGAVAAYRRAFAAARDLDQIQAASRRLRQLGENVDLPRHMGFILRWWLIGPFDNTAEKGFDTAYPPEREIRLDAQYEGKTGPVRWVEHVTGDDYGLVDLNAFFGRPRKPGSSVYEDSPETLRRCKGAVAYAYSEFLSAEAREVELRLGCISGNKVWLNGELVLSNQVYHAAMAVDQYVGRGRLEKGANAILAKICQNEQPESWAQNWQFQLRVCDRIGTGILCAAREQP